MRSPHLNDSSLSLAPTKSNSAVANSSPGCAAAALPAGLSVAITMRFGLPPLPLAGRYALAVPARPAAVDVADVDDVDDVDDDSVLSDAAERFVVVVVVVAGVVVVVVVVDDDDASSVVDGSTSMTRCSAVVDATGIFSTYVLGNAPTSFGAVVTLDDDDDDDDDDG